MSNRQVKLGAVTMGAGGPGQHFQWADSDILGNASVNIGWYSEQAQLAEAAKFDLVFIVDSQFITPDSPPHYLNRLEPMTLLSALAVVTRQHRPGRHHDHVVQRPVQPGPAARLAGADQRRAVRVERGDQRRRRRGRQFQPGRAL